MSAGKPPRQPGRQTDEQPSREPGRAPSRKPGQEPEGIIPLNAPRPVAVETGRHGEPTAVIWRGSYQRIAAIRDTWRIDDEWWRDEIARRYYVIELPSGRRLTIYRDLVGDAWYLQPYEGPRSAAAG